MSGSASHTNADVESLLRPCRRMYRFDDVDLELSEHNTTQLAVYDICNKAFGRRHRWLAFIDVDEFLVSDVRDRAPDPTRISP